jgi:hypothetical protein
MEYARPFPKDRGQSNMIDCAGRIVRTFFATEVRAKHGSEATLAEIRAISRAICKRFGVNAREIKVTSDRQTGLAVIDIENPFTVVVLARRILESMNLREKK